MKITILNDDSKQLCYENVLDVECVHGSLVIIFVSDKPIKPKVIIAAGEWRLSQKLNSMEFSSKQPELKINGVVIDENSPPFTLKRGDVVRYGTEAYYITEEVLERINQFIEDFRKQDAN